MPAHIAAIIRPALQDLNVSRPTRLIGLDRYKGLITLDCLAFIVLKVKVPCLEFFFSGGYITIVFLLAFVFCLIFSFVG